MAERLHQLQFDELFREAGPLDVTPHRFAGLQYPTRDKITRTEIAQLGRFVREVKEEVFAISPQGASISLVDKVYTPFELFDQEEPCVLLRNAKNRVTQEAMIYRGTVNTGYIRVAELFREAIRVNATGIILAHSHPSGS